MTSPSSLPRIAVIGTGGTISAVGRHSLELIQYITNKTMYDVHELLARVPEAERVAEVVPVPYAALPSTSIEPSHWLELNERIHSLVEEDPELHGIVLTHGTATLEETAFFLGLTLKVDRTVVVTGAQRPASGLSTDAFLNLVNALRVAGSEAARGLGVVVMLNDEIHAAREVAKTATQRLQTFRTPDFGALGQADADGVHIYRRPVRRRAPDTEFDVRGADAGELPRVDVSLSYAERTAPTSRRSSRPGRAASSSPASPPASTRRARSGPSSAPTNGGWCSSSRAGWGAGGCLRSPATSSSPTPSSRTTSLPGRPASCSCWPFARPGTATRSAGCSKPTEGRVAGAPRSTRRFGRNTPVVPGRTKEPGRVTHRDVRGERGPAPGRFARSRRVTQES